MRFYIDLPIKRKLKLYIQIFIVTFLVLKAPDIYFLATIKKTLLANGAYIVEDHKKNRLLKPPYSKYFKNEKIIKAIYFDGHRLNNLYYFETSVINRIPHINSATLWGNGTLVNFSALSQNNSLLLLDGRNLKGKENKSNFYIQNKKLKELHLIESTLDELAFSENLKIEVLNLQGSKIKNIIGVERLKNLKVLNLANTGVVDISCLKDLNTLQSLDVHACNIKNLSPILKLKKLETLSLNINNNMPFLKNLTQLKKLNIWYYSPTINISNVGTESEKIRTLERQLKEIKETLPDCKIYSNFKQSEWDLY